MEKPEEGTDWHPDGANVPYWVVVLAIVLLGLLLASVVGLITGLAGLR